jgi:hypothetical protein
MKKNKMFFMIAGVIFFSLFFFSVAKTEGGDGWILYGTSDDGKHFYDKNSLTNVSPNIIRVREKIKYSKAFIDNVKKESLVMKGKNQPVLGYDKLDNAIGLKELDCRNNTIRLIKWVTYNNQGRIIQNKDTPNPKIVQVISGSIGESLLNKVCPN